MLGEIRNASCLSEQRKWNILVKNAMESDYSWEDSAKEYMELYQRI